jgi:hypothetical protein
MHGTESRCIGTPSRTTAQPKQPKRLRRANKYHRKMRLRAMTLKRKAAKGAESRWDNRETALAALMGWTSAPMATAAAAATTTTARRHAHESKARRAKTAGRFPLDIGVSGY